MFVESQIVKIGQGVSARFGRESSESFSMYSWFSSKPFLMLQEDTPVGKEGEFIQIIDVYPAKTCYLKL